MKRRIIALACGLLLVIGATVLLVTWLNKPAPQQIAYTNISHNTKICVVSTSTDTAAPIWHAVQTAANQAPVNAQQLIAPSKEPDQLVPFINGLLALHCKLIIATGADLHDPIISVAKANPHQEFATDTTANLPNVQHITDPAQIPDMIHTASNH